MKYQKPVICAIPWSKLDWVTDRKNTMFAHERSDNSASFRIPVKVLSLFDGEPRHKEGRQKFTLQTHSVVLLHGNL